MNPKTKALLIHIAGLIACIVPPAIATIEYIPIISEEPKKQISAFGIILLALCTVPFWKSIKTFLKSPSAWKVWLVGLVFCYVCRAIVDELLIVSAIGLPAGIIGSAIFWIERKYRERNMLLDPKGAAV